MKQTASLMHTLKTFWTGKRFLKLFIFALLLGNITMYTVGMLARRQVLINSGAHHSKVYTAYMQTVERARKEATDQPPGALHPADVSPYWIALREIRKQYPFFRMNVILSNTVEGEADKGVMDTLKNRPRGWSLTDEKEGWSRSFFVLPTRNTAAFQVVSYVRDDMSAWEDTAIVMGIYGFMLLFAFGWFWTRSFDSIAELQPSAEVTQRIKAIGKVSDELGVAIEALGASVDKVPGAEQLRELDEAAAQIRMLAINGSIEAARSADSYRVFHVIMQEINQLATHSRELLKDAKAAAEPQDPAAGPSYRRAG